MCVCTYSVYTIVYSIQFTEYSSIVKLIRYALRYF